MSVSIFIALVWPPGHEPFSLKMLVDVGKHFHRFGVAARP
jgi:hypothetical protein